MRELPVDEFLNGQTFGSPIREGQNNAPARVTSAAPKPPVVRKINEHVYEVNGKLETRNWPCEPAAVSDIYMLHRDEPGNAASPPKCSAPAYAKAPERIREAIQGVKA